MSKIANARKLAEELITEFRPPSLDERQATAEGANLLEEVAYSGEPGPSDWRAQVQWLSLQVSDVSPLLSAQHEERHAAEQYRIVRTKIIQHPRNLAMIVVSSPGTGDGKTVTAVNLAAALAMRSDEQVLLLDADFRRSILHHYLGMSKAPGLADVLAAMSRFEDIVYRVEDLPNLYVLPSGEGQLHPTELLDSGLWRSFSRRIRQQFQRVIVDCPPVEAEADYHLITAVCDGVLLVVRPDHTDRGLCLEALNTVGDKLLGVLINDVRGLRLRKIHLFRC